MTESSDPVSDGDAGVWGRGERCGTLKVHCRPRRSGTYNGSTLSISTPDFKAIEIGPWRIHEALRLACAEVNEIEQTIRDY